MQKIIIDTDGNLEALKALKKILKEYEKETVAITCSASALSVEEAVSNVLHILKETERDIPVYHGQKGPMIKAPAEKRLDSHELYNSEIIRTDTERSAIDVLIESSEDLEIISMGPLSNIAMALIKNTDAMLKVKRIYILGGMVFHGDVGPMSEFNIYHDAVAADRIMKSGIPLTLLPIEVGSYEERIEFVLHPEKITKQYDCYARVELNGEYTYGASINDVRDRNRKEFVSQNNVMYPFNSILILDNAKEEITMEA